MVTIPAKTLLDSGGNYNVETVLEMGTIPIANDTDVPVITKVAGESSVNNSTKELIVTFTVTDANFDFEQAITNGELSVQGSWFNWGNISSATATIISETKIENGKKYKVRIGGLTGFSGSARLTVSANAVTDLLGKGNAETTIDA